MYFTELQPFANDRNQIQVAYANSTVSRNNLYFSYGSTFFQDDVLHDVPNNQK